MGAGAGLTRTVSLALAVAFTIATLSAGVGASADGAEGAAEREPKRGKQPKRKPQRRPNLVVIQTDDQWNTLLGMPWVRTRLAKGGTTFTNSYASFPLCCPSRATLLTGQYAHNHGLLSNNPSTGGGYPNLLGKGNTLPVWLRRAGYRTIHVGKYLPYYPAGRKKEVPPGWSRWFGLIRNTGRMYRYAVNDNRRIRKYGRATRNYMTDQLARTAVSELTRFLPRPRPLYLHFTVHAPHGEFLPRTAPRNPRPAPRHLGRYRSLSVPQPPSFDEEDVSDKPAFVRDRPQLSDLDLSLLTRRYRGGIESLLAVDQAVRRIVTQLRKNGELRRTLIIFTSDNGLMLGEHRLRGKDVLYEEAVRVPLVIRGPGFPRGAVRTQLVSNVDLVPTILKLTRARPGRTLDGRRLQPVARDPSTGAERVLLLETRTAKAIRTERYVYIEHSSGERELYDMRADPFQLQSLHDDPGFDGIEASLAARLSEIRSCRGVACP